MKSNYRKLSDFIKEIDRRNIEDNRGNLLGLSVSKCFIPSIANTVGTDFKKYKIIERGQFAYIPDTSRRGDKIAIALLKDHDFGLLSNVYTVFEVSCADLIPEFLELWFKRPEFDRYARFKSHGSAREIFDWEQLCNVELPILTMEEQHQIVSAFRAIDNRIDTLRQLNDKLAASAEALCMNFASGIDHVDKLSSICELVNGRAYSKPELLSEGQYKVLRVGNFFTNNEWYYSNMELEPKKYCDNGDLLICWSASFGAYIWSGGKVIFHYHIWKVDLDKSDPMFRNYLYLYLKHELESLKREGHGSVMVHLTKNGMDNLILPVPSVDELKDFNRKVDPIVEYMGLIQEEIRLNEVLKQEILSQLV